MVQLNREVESLVEHREYKNGYYINYDKSQWRDSFVNLLIVTES